MVIPHGASAAKAWRALPWRVRREVLKLGREGLPHPQTDVAAVAIGYARRAETETEIATYCIIATAVTAVMVTYAAHRGFSLPAFAMLFVVVLALFLWEEHRRSRTLRPLAHGFAANLQAVASRHDLGAGTPLRVRSRRYLRWRPSAAHLCMGIIVSFVLLGDALANPTQNARSFWMEHHTIVTTFVLVVAAESLLSTPPHWQRRRPRAGEQVLILGDESLSVPYLGVAVGWSRVRRVEYLPAPTYGKEGVSFLFHDPQHVLETTRAPNARAATHLKRRLKPAGTLSFPTEWLDCPPEVIIATANRLIGRNAQSATAAG